MTVKYNGWIGPNPNGYTTEHQIHYQFESPFVAANIHAPEVQAKMTPVKLIEGDMFDAYVAYLRHTASYVEKVYQLDKAGGFAGRGHARIARLYRRAPGRRGQHVARHDLHGMDLKRAAGSGPVRGEVSRSRRWQLRSAKADVTEASGNAQMTLVPVFSLRSG